MTYIVLLTIITAAELQADMLATMQAAGLPTSSWQTNGIWQNLVNWVSLLLRGMYGILNDVARNAFLETASGQGLVDLGTGTFGTAYRNATFATGTITLLNESGAPINEAVEAISFAQVADSSITYRNTESIEAWLNGTELILDLQCDVAGTDGNVLAAAVAPFNIELVTTMVGVSIVSHSAFVGQDDQDEDEYKALCRKQAGSLSPGGAMAAWEWFPLNLNTDGTVSEEGDGKTRVNINRVLVDSDNSQGIVNLALASPSGAVDGTEYTITIAFLEQYVLTNPGTLNDANCSAVTVAVTATVTLRKGTSTSGVQEEIEEALTDYFPDTSIGGDDGFLTVEELKATIYRANRNIHAITMTLPAADVALTDTEVAVAGAFNITVTVQP